MKKLFNILLIIFVSTNIVKAVPQLTGFTVLPQYLQNGSITVYNTGDREFFASITGTRNLSGSSYENGQMEIVFYAVLNNQETVLKTLDITSSDFDAGYLAYNETPSNAGAKNLVKITLPQNLKNAHVRVKYRNKDSQGNWVSYIILSTIYYTINVSPPTTFYNIAKSHIFYKNTCNWANQDGSAVTYTIPAGAYNSTISQADADRQAEYALFFGGQSYANTNGSCTSNPNKIITNADFPTYSDTFEVNVLWNINHISSSTVSFEVYQYGVLKGLVASNISNNGSANLQIIGLLQQDGHTFRNVRLKIISDANPSVFEYTAGVDWFVD